MSTRTINATRATAQRKLAASLAALSMLATLAACNSADEQSASGAAQAVVVTDPPGTVIAPAPGTANATSKSVALGVSPSSSSDQWTTVATEGQSFSFSGSQSVRYGANGTYATMTVTGGGNCTNDAFATDPLPGVVKHCDIVSTPVATTATDSAAWTTIASEGQSFSVSGTQSVRFGANGSYIAITVTGGGNCTNDAFGSDPLYGTVKHCDVTSTTTTASTPTPVTTTTPTPTTSTAWTTVATEGQSFSFSGTQSVRYGANDSYVIETITGGGNCTNGAFGIDPLYGVVKHCDLIGTPAVSSGVWTTIAIEGQPFTITGTQSVRYGANASYYVMSFTNGGACSNTAFGGDPLPGIVKHCDVVGAPPSPTVSPKPAVTSPTANLTVTQKNGMRLLNQATFGATQAEYTRLNSMGMAGWVDDQLAMPQTNYLPPQSVGDVSCPGGDTTDCRIMTWTPWLTQLNFYQNAVSAPDQLRQRVAMALGQILVISGTPPPSQEGAINPWSMRMYQQIIMDNALGNYRTLLEQVTLNAEMGKFLNMVNNAKASGLDKPNENFAREVLQLFSTGLLMLNQDGTVVMGSDGRPTPAFGQDVIHNFSLAFTGWTYPPAAGATTSWPNPWSIGQMVPVDAYHDQSAKTLAYGQQVPANQTAVQDLKAALDNIFNHPNVGPFIGKQLIQFLVTSNPSPAYVSRVAGVFNDNGQGVRGDLKAVVRQILLDPEARGDEPVDPNFGRLKDPVLLFTGLIRATGGVSDGATFNQWTFPLLENMFTPDTVFGFYSPSYLMPGSTSLLGPQFGIQNSTTANSRLYLIEQFTFAAHGVVAGPGAGLVNTTGTKYDVTQLSALAGDTNALIEAVNNMLVYGTMTVDEKADVANAISGFASYDLEGRAQMALYMVASSPRYQIIY